MNDTLAEWISKAEGDYQVANAVWRARKFINYDAVCFHCQQMAEKYLKAHLFDHKVNFPKTHSLIDLLELCLQLDPSFELQREPLERLEDYAVRYRYPGISAEKDEARLALRAAGQLREFLRGKLNEND